MYRPELVKFYVILLVKNRSFTLKKKITSGCRVLVAVATEYINYNNDSSSGSGIYDSNILTRVKNMSMLGNEFMENFSDFKLQVLSSNLVYRKH